MSVSEANAQRVPPGVTVQSEIAYVENGRERQRLDIYRPAEMTDGETLPLVIWIHGGGWQKGSKNNPLPVRLGLVQRGYAVASVGYRLTDAGPFPMQADDCRAAITFLRDHADEYGFDTDRFGVIGASAGGHLSAMMGLLDGDRDTGLTCVVDLFGPSDLIHFAEVSQRVASDNSPEYKLLGGPVLERRDLARAASPITHVDADDPPFLILHGTEDPLVPLSQSERLHDKLLAAGVESHLLVVEGGGHGRPGFDKIGVLATIEAFLTAHLKGDGTCDLPERITVSAK